jgi:hypothetical protein
VRRLVDNWRAFWRDFNCEAEWRFPELPPVQLQKAFGVPWGFIDRGEFQRAEWMWTRKPKLVLGEGFLGYALVVLVALLLLLVPHIGVLLTIGWSFAMLGVIARDIVRPIRWRREYEVSITRIVRSYRHSK